MTRIKVKRICIIKLKSAGDVIRTTPILRAFTGCDISWITDKKSYPFIKDNPKIAKLLLIENIRELERFDALYNFDEDKRACKIAERAAADVKKGYGWRNNKIYPFDQDSEYAYRLTQDDELKFKLNKKTYQRVIFEMAGMKWKGEDYLLNYQPAKRVMHRVGLNYMVGDKFPNKFWVNWKILLKLVPGISVQEKFSTPQDYINWVNSCAIIVTNDSLGMHIALGLKKKVVALFGTTSMHEIEMYGRGIKLSASLPCSPCYKKEKCDIGASCMKMISAKTVSDAVKRLSVR